MCPFFAGFPKTTPSFSSVDRCERFNVESTENCNGFASGKDCVNMFTAPCTWFMYYTGSKSLVHMPISLKTGKTCISKRGKCRIISSKVHYNAIKSQKRGSNGKHGRCLMHLNVQSVKLSPLNVVNQRKYLFMILFMRHLCFTLENHLKFYICVCFYIKPFWHDSSKAFRTFAAK